MSEKYIIKNCPAYQKELVTLDFKTGETKATDKNYCMNPFLPNKCQVCTDCLLKRIIKITKNYNKGCGKHCDINRKENNCGKTCNAYKIRQILELLDIEEVE